MIFLQNKEKLLLFWSLPPSTLRCHYSPSWSHHPTHLRSDGSSQFSSVPTSVITSSDSTPIQMLTQHPAPRFLFLFLISYDLLPSSSSPYDHNTAWTNCFPKLFHIQHH